MWGNYSFDYACSLARGRSGGFISMWDPNNFVKDDIWCDDAYIIVKGRWKNSVGACYMINIYGPHDLLAKSALWDRIRDFMHCNSVKSVFNTLFSWSNLIDLPLVRPFIYMDEQTRKETECTPSTELCMRELRVTDPNLLNRFFSLLQMQVSKPMYSIDDFPHITNSSRSLMLLIVLFLRTNACMEKLRDAVWDCFGLSWRSWIKACLESSRTSILINGSPTFEFNVRRGLRQGDPLSPFLFIIIMEGLHVALTNSVRSGLIRGINFGSPDLNLCHLFFANDVIITTDWNVHDLDNVIRIFQVFFLASGLKINVHKSSIYGIGVASDDVQIMAANTGCSAGTLPLTYLSLPIGSNMSLFVNWKPLVDKFRLKLSNLLSYGGRLTLIKAVLGSLGIYFFSLFKAPVAVLKALESARASFFFFPGGGSTDSKKLSWVKWSNVFASLDKGGLAIALHGNEGGFDLHGCNFRGIWSKIVGTSNYLHSPLYTRFARLFRLEQDKDCLVMDRISNGQWSWNWSRDNIGIRNSSYLKNLLEEISHIEVRDNADKCFWALDPNG
ncbi:putative RNA-directed DNA polymerase, eukaryota, reverse transcriptase zinc-binding domain protein [Tanacetum coccineum]